MSIKDATTNAKLSEFAAGGDFWSGGSKHIVKVEDTSNWLVVKTKNVIKWQWSDGSPWTFQNWGLGEPNDLGEDEDHIVVFGDGGWNDAMENETFPFICQHETKGSNHKTM